MNKIYIVLIMFFLHFYVIGQDQTVGLFLNDNNSFNGYILFNPFASTSTYLIDNCGREINKWESSYKPNFAVYLLDNGNLLRSCKTTSNPNIGGRLEEFDWDGNIIWSYNFPGEFLLHHDIKPLPNGNILVIANDVISPEDAEDEGRNPLFIDNELWSEQIFEIMPIGEQDMSIVWNWRVRDHLIQDFDSLRNNFGVISGHPELLDLNYIDNNVPNALVDWLHFNSIDYNEDLDQIIISARNMSEIYIIDHSTTTFEASGHNGGIYNKGGDLLYRFGNPKVYNMDTDLDQVLFYQHDAHWIPDGYPNGGKVIVFNNKISSTTSGVGFFLPRQDSSGFYSMPGEFGYLPNCFEWEYASEEIYSPKMAGVQELPNGNIVMCVATSGKFLEIDIDGNLIWNYVNPIGNNGPVAQGEDPGINNVFKIQKYAPDFPGFYGKDLTPGLPIELNPWPMSCDIQEDTLAEIEIKVFLEGPFNGTKMVCHENNIIPLSQPFNIDPWHYAGTEKVDQLPDDIIDWVLLELRDSEQPDSATFESIVSRQAAFITSNGTLVGMDGVSPPKFYNSFLNDLYLVIHQRNHLSIISSVPLATGDSIYNYDFTLGDDKVLGGILGYKEIKPEIWGMVSGDGNSDNCIDSLDKNTIWSSQVGEKGYLQGDYNIDNEVDNKDKNDLLLLNIGKVSQVPE